MAKKKHYGKDRKKLWKGQKHWNIYYLKYLKNFLDQIKSIFLPIYPQVYASDKCVSSDRKLYVNCINFVIYTVYENKNCQNIT